MMTTVDRRLAGSEKAILKSLEGATLISMEAALAAPPNVAWNVVRLRTDRGCVDVTCTLETLPLNSHGDEEEFGVVHAARAPEGALDVSGISEDTSVAQVGREVTGVQLVHDRLDVSEWGAAAYRRETTKAVVLLTDGDAICLDRQVWFEEMLAVTQGSRPGALVRDQGDDFADDEEEDLGVHYELTTSLERL